MQHKFEDISAIGLKERKLAGVMKCKLRSRVEVYEQDCEDFCFCKTSRLSSPPSQQQVNEVKSSYFESVFRREGVETKMAVRMHMLLRCSAAGLKSTQAQCCGRNDLSKSLLLHIFSKNLYKTVKPFLQCWSEKFNLTDIS